MIDLTTLPIQVFEECPACKGSGIGPGLGFTCMTCNGSRHVKKVIKMSDLQKMMQEMARAAVEQALSEREKV